MQWAGIRTFTAAAVVAAVACSGGCGRQAPSTSKAGAKIVAVAGIAPLAYFTQRIGDGLVEVELLVPPAANPHTYQPDPRQMKKLAQASVLVLNGLGIEFWAAKALETVQNPNLVIVHTSNGIPLIDSDEHGRGANPHVWLDPLNAALQARSIERALAKADPKNEAVYRRNAQRLVSDLRELDNWIRQGFTGVKSRAFVSSHPAWSYFAKRYGLIEAAVIEKSPGREPSPAEIRQIIEVIKRHRVKAVFIEPQSASKAAEAVAEETGAKLIVLDPLGAPPDYDYFETMRRNVTKMLEALR